MEKIVIKIDDSKLIPYYWIIIITAILMIIAQIYGWSQNLYLNLIKTKNNLYMSRELDLMSNSRDFEKSLKSGHFVQMLPPGIEGYAPTGN